MRSMTPRRSRWERSRRTCPLRSRVSTTEVTVAGLTSSRLATSPGRRPSSTMSIRSRKNPVGLMPCRSMIRHTTGPDSRDASPNSRPIGHSSLAGNAVRSPKPRFSTRRMLGA